MPAWFWRVLAPTFTLITYTILFEQIGQVDFKAGIPYFFVMTAAIPVRTSSLTGPACSDISGRLNW